MKAAGQKISARLRQRNPTLRLLLLALARFHRKLLLALLVERLRLLGRFLQGRRLRRYVHRRPEAGDGAGDPEPVAGQGDSADLLAAGDPVPLRLQHGTGDHVVRDVRRHMAWPNWVFSASLGNERLFVKRSFRHPRVLLMVVNPVRRTKAKFEKRYP